MALLQASAAFSNAFWRCKSMINESMCGCRLMDCALHESMLGDVKTSLKPMPEGSPSPWSFHKPLVGKRCVGSGKAWLLQSISHRLYWSNKPADTGESHAE
jgi:hypothetical protein